MSGERDGGDDPRDLAHAPTLAAALDDWSGNHAPVLVDNEVVAKRYRILRYIARGGMGEVYEAEDRTLGERVALKTIREGAKDRVSEERFKREIQLSRKVTHPNVCRIFDVGFHERPDGERVVFLTMELLLGETLLQRITREGAMPIAEAIAVVRQLSAGLSAAHAVHVVHRDLKSANVLLVPRKSGGVRVVITDFGLAHFATEEGGAGRTLSGAGGIVGTPGYMAPEQVEGGEITDRTDVYALGVVMYEMVTGRLPFDGATPMSIATKRLTTPAPSPRKLRADLPIKWERAVLACLARDPAERPESARAVLGLLGAITDSLEEIDGTVRIPRTPKRIPLVRPALAMSAIIIALVVAQRWRKPAPHPTRVTVATLPFVAVGPKATEAQGLGSIAAETLVLYLSSGATLHIQDVKSVNNAMQDVGVTAGAAPTASQLDQLRAVLSVDYFISGRFDIGADGHAVTIDAELVDAKFKKAVVVAHETGSVDQLTEPLHRVGQRFAPRLGAKASDLGAGVGFTLPHRPSTLRALMESRELLSRDEYKAAAIAAQRGLVEEPEYARLHWHLAQAHHLSGYERSAAEEAKLAVKLAATLPRHERLLLEGLGYSLANDRATSIARLETLHAEIPNDEETSLQLAEQYGHADRRTEALNLVARLRQAPLSPEGRHRVELVDAVVAEAGGDFDAALRSVRRAFSTSALVDSRSARARARYAECRLLDILRRAPEARVACEDARRIASEIGLRRLRAQSIYIIAWLDFTSGDIEKAQAEYESLLEVYRETGDAASESSVLNSLANIASARGDREQGRKLLEDAVRISDVVEDAIAGATPRENLSDLALEDGDLPRALSLAEAAEKALEGSGEPTERISALCRVATVYVAMGRGRDIARKVSELEAVEAQLVSSPPADPVCSLLHYDLALGRNDLPKLVDVGRSMVEHAVASVDEGELLTGRVTFATALLLNGDCMKAAEQVKLAEPLAAKFKGGSPAAELMLLRFRIDVANGAVPDGAARMKILARMIDADPAPARKIANRIALARAGARVTGAPRAVQALRSLSAESKQLGLVSASLEAELYATELAADSGHKPSVRELKEYGQRARDAARAGWAERFERTVDRGRSD